MTPIYLNHPYWERLYKSPTRNILNRENGRNELLTDKELIQFRTQIILPYAGYALIDGKQRSLLGINALGRYVFSKNGKPSDKYKRIEIL